MFRVLYEIQEVKGSRKHVITSLRLFLLPEMHDDQSPVLHVSKYQQIYRIFSNLILNCEQLSNVISWPILQTYLCLRQCLRILFP